MLIVRLQGCVCVCLHTGLSFVGVRASVNVCMLPSVAAGGMNGGCVCASLELKVDLCYSTTRWQNAAILQTEPMLGWPRYCNSFSCSQALGLHGTEYRQRGAV